MSDWALWVTLVASILGAIFYLLAAVKTRSWSDFGGALFALVAVNLCIQLLSR